MKKTAFQVIDMSNFKIDLLFTALNQIIGLLIGIYVWQVE